LLKKNHQNNQKHESEDTTLSHRQSGKHLDQEDMVSSASPIKILCSCKLQRDHLMSVGQRNNGRSRCPHDVKRDGRNIRERAMVLLCRLGRLQMGEGTSGSSF
jgi:hypothetical protein